MSKYNRTFNENGFSLIEIILVIIAVFFLALLIANLPSSVSSINKSRHTSIARDIAAKQIDYLRKQPYENLAFGTNSFPDSSLDRLAGAAAAYEIESCPLSICADTELVKQVKVTVTWLESGESKTVELVTLVGQGGIGQ